MKKILLIEDDENMNRGLTLRLRKEGYDVLPAFCLKDAGKLLDERVDLVISDITLPDGNGMDFCRRLRGTSDVYLIYLTALDREIDMVSGYDSGADDYITKPFSLAVLVSKVNALMRRLGETERKCLVSGDITLQLETMQAVQNGEIIPLSKREFQILKLLMENAGRIVTKERMLESVWDLDGLFVDDNTIAVNISRLKSKLNTDMPVNVRGVGYLWTESVTTGRSS